jgi:hypothetical protein
MRGEFSVAYVAAGALMSRSAYLRDKLRMVVNFSMDASAGSFWLRAGDVCTGRGGRKRQPKRSASALNGEIKSAVLSGGSLRQRLHSA